MLKNYFRVAWRNLTKNKIYSFINIVGLAIGMAIALLIGLLGPGRTQLRPLLPYHSRIAVGMITQASPGQPTYTGDVITNIMGTTFRSQYSDLFTHTAQYADGGSGILINTGYKTVTGSAIWAQATPFHVWLPDP